MGSSRAAFILSLGLAGCGPPPAASFFLEDGGLALIVDNPNKPPARQETWERESAGAWKHCSRMDISRTRAEVQQTLDSSPRTYVATETGWTQEGNEITFEDMGLGGNRLSLCSSQGPPGGDALLDGFLRTALSQLNFADAKAFLDAQQLEPRAVERTWAPSEGAMAGVLVEIPAAKLEPSLKYLGNVGLLPGGKQLHITDRPDDSSVTVLVEPGRDDATTTVSLVVENRKNSQLW